MVRFKLMTFSVPQKWVHPFTQLRQQNGRTGAAELREAFREHLIKHGFSTVVKGCRGDNKNKKGK